MLREVDTSSTLCNMQIILFKTRQKKVHETLKVKINNMEIKQVESTIFLGINIDSGLTWKQHINYIKGKISKTSGRARQYVSTSTLRNININLLVLYIYISLSIPLLRKYYMGKYIHV